jgi:Polyketide cyclase / dehydrase and lipid transport
MKSDITKPNITALTRIAALGALAFLSVGVSPAHAATLSRSVDVSGTPSAVWSMIGPFCAIKDWLPPVGTCTEKEGSPPERTLVTKDGKATFVETLTARSDIEHSYSYAFKIESVAGHRLHIDHQGAGQNSRHFHRHVEQHLRSRPWQGTGCAGSTDRNLRRRPRHNQSEVCEIAASTAALAPAAGYDPAAGRRQSGLEAAGVALRAPPSGITPD